MTPPGIRSLQPHLALSYDSASPAGIAGPGWNLVGVSTISRCNRTYAQDGAPAPITLTQADAFCLDGNRLRLTSSETLTTYGAANTTYQTEIANFSLITASPTTAGNGPSYFTVQGKDGLTYEYGNTTDSKVVATSGGTPYVWALDKVTDRFGNYMTYTYAQTNGSFVLASIQYAALSGTTTFPNQIVFTYTTQSAIAKYIAGTQVLQTQQLSAITVNSAGSAMQSYQLGYSALPSTLRPRLVSIQQCGLSTSPADCLPPTSVGYQAGTPGLASLTTASGSGATNSQLYSFDIDGDGRKDLIFATGTGTSHWWVQFASVSGYGAPVDTHLVTGQTDPVLFDDFLGQGKISFLAPQGGVWTMVSWNGTAFVATPTGLALDTNRQPSTTHDYATADVNGDGLPDLVAVLSDGSIHTRLNTGNGSSLSFGSATASSTGGGLSGTMQIAGNNQFPSSNVQHIDVNGDGRDDIVYSGNVNTNCHIVSGGIVCSQLPQFKVLVANGTGFDIGITVNLGGSPTNFLPINFNNDACTDFIIPGSNSIYIAGCNGGAATTIAAPANIVAALDWDGDGQTDLLANVGGILEVFRSQGTSLGGAAPTGISVPNGPVVVTDQNGDGLDDLAYANAAASFAISFGLHNGAGVAPDLATSFMDGYGNSANPAYVSIVQSNYSAYPFASPVYPFRNYLVPLYVVNQAIFSDPSNPPNGTYDQTFLYTGAWKDLQGRGFSNFLTWQQFDSRNGLWTRLCLSNKFPWTGMHECEELSQDQLNNQLLVLSGTSNETFTALDSTANNQRYFPYFGTTSTLNYEINTNLISTTTTNYTYDTSGNAIQVATTVTDNDAASPYVNDTWTSTTANTIAPQTGSTWCLSLPTQTTVTNSSTAPGGASITRTVAYTPDYAHCQQTQQVTEPNSALYKVTEAFGYDPATGNLLTDTVTGVGMTPRVTTYTWNATAQFPATVQNPLGQAVALGFDSRFGTKTSQTDPNSTTANPIVTTWQYDEFGRVASELRPDGTLTEWGHSLCTSCDPLPRLMVTRQVLDTARHVVTTSNLYYDMLDRQIYQQDTLLNGATAWTTVRKFDSVGRVHTESFPYLTTSSSPGLQTYAYDALNRLTTIQRPVSATNPTLQTTSWGYSGRTTTVTDPPTAAAPSGRINTTISLPSGLLAKTKDNSGYNVSFTYDSFGSLLSAVDSSAPAVTLYQGTYGYGVKAFQVSSTDSDLGPWTKTFDALGEVTSYIDAKGQNFSFIYDALSRPTQRTEPDLITNWTWGNSAANFNVGKLQSVTAASSPGTYSESYVYDSKVRLSTKTVVVPGDATYTYTQTYNSLTGLLDTLQYPVSTASYQMKLQYSYANGILQQIKDITAGGPGTNYWTANTTNPQGQILQETFGNGVVASHAFDAVTGRVQSIQAGVGGGAALQNNSYLFDAVGNLTQRQDNNLGLTENAFPDSLYRLDHTVGDSNTQVAYDGMGRILTFAAYGKPTVTNDYTTPQSGCTYYANAQVHAVRKSTSSTGTSTSFCYDANGNMTNITAGISVGSIGWTSFNQPSAITSGTTSGQLYYNADHQRYKQAASFAGSPETTIYVSGLLEKVINSSGTTYRHYISAGNNTVLYTRMSTDSNLTYYITKDHLGSSAVITDQTGALVVKERFGPQGVNENTATEQATIAGITRHEFTGQEQINNTGVLLVNMNGRIYSPTGSTFLSADPYVSDPGNTQNYNRYAYVNNNPLTYVDPTGYDCTLTTTGNPGQDGTAGFQNPDGSFTDGQPVVANTLQTTLSGCFGGGGTLRGSGSGGGGGGPPANRTHQLRCGFQHALTGAIGGAITGAALAISTGQLEGLTPIALGTAAFAGGALNVLASNGDLPGVAVAGIISTVIQTARAVTGQGFSGGFASQIVSDALGGAVPPSVTGVAISGATSGTIAAGTAAATGETFGLGVLGAGGAFATSTVLGVATTLGLDKLLAPVFGCTE